ncbi:TolB family protein [Rasiella sp. SM2506]|uniref:TolB family protein n=1 Tax=Rasiella sp. SM2506 TaxID=3423914 RepID=UPI003D7B5A07
MKNHIIKFSVLVSVLFLGACKTEKTNAKESDLSTEESLYLGQKPPGLMPEPFAPGLVTTGGWEYNGSFTPDLKEFYFLRKAEEKDGKSKTELVVVQNNNDQWQKSVVSPRVGTPFISPDGKIMYLSKKYRERTNKGGWSELKNLDAPFDSLPTMRLTVSSKGTYFFDEFKRDFTGDIRYSRIVDGKYEEPKLLNKKINTGKNFHPFIAPDESYLIFDSKREGGYGDSGIYIIFRRQDGSWGNPINLGDKINTKAWEACASITPDGKYLFFNRNMGSKNYENVDIFWVSTEVLENLRPE